MKKINVLLLLMLISLLIAACDADVSSEDNHYDHDNMVSQPELAVISNQAEQPEPQTHPDMQNQIEQPSSAKQHQQANTQEQQSQPDADNHPDQPEPGNDLETHAETHPGTRPATHPEQPDMQNEQNQPGTDNQPSQTYTDNQPSMPRSENPTDLPGEGNQHNPWQPPTPGYHVTIDGTPSGNGSREQPWDLATGLSSESIKPGDTVYIHAGIYRGVFTSQLRGTQSVPIHVRPWHNDAVIIDGGGHMISNSATPGILIFGGQHTWLSGITITNSATNHLRDYINDASYDGVHFIGPGNKLLNCVIYGNSGNGIGFWNPAVNAEVSGCIIYHNGAIGPNRGHGHGIYVQQGASGSKTIRNNIIFNSFGKGIQVYGTGVEIHNTIIEDNIFYDAALAAGSLEQSVYIGGILRANNHIVRNNVFYASPGHSGTPASAKFGDTFGNVDTQTNGEAVFTGNYCVDSFLHITRRWERMTTHGNTYIAKTGTDRVVVGYDVFTNVALRDYDRNVYHRGTIGENNATGFERLPLSAVQVEPWLQELNSAYHDTLPTRNAVFVKPAGIGSEVSRWHVAVLNWEGSRSVNVTVPNLTAGAEYAVYYASGLQSGPVSKGTYNGTSISIPLNSAPTDTPRGMEAHASLFIGTLPDFGAFLIITES